MQEDNNSNNSRTWLKFTQIGLQMILTIGLGTWFGYWLDNRSDSKTPVYTLILSLTSIGVSLYNVIRQLPKQ
ncbi:MULTISPECIES: AtpZ/AtpI family protein [Emticicia]|uniref:AtpZ/AtpI family protein n=1 Tax=Emticicia TaxID=312278 RepID=UPI0020A069CF|nr:MULTISPECIES: AtpZ/AtpI family protein [Emticicia]UTA66804.1 AtpZ/AtpI family protein [Emticicia sp. 21SJ11W-3]